MARILTFWTSKDFQEAIQSMIPVLNVYFVNITKELFEPSWAPDLHPYLYAILAVHYSKQPETIEEPESFLAQTFGQKGTSDSNENFTLPSSISLYDKQPLDYLDTVCQAMVSFERYASATGSWLVESFPNHQMSARRLGCYVPCCDFNYIQNYSIKNLPTIAIKNNYPG